MPTRGDCAAFSPDVYLLQVGVCPCGRLYGQPLHLLCSRSSQPFSPFHKTYNNTITSLLCLLPSMPHDSITVTSRSKRYTLLRYPISVINSTPIPEVSMIQAKTAIMNKCGSSERCSPLSFRTKWKAAGKALKRRSCTTPCNANCSNLVCPGRT